METNTKRFYALLSNEEKALRGVKSYVGINFSTSLIIFKLSLLYLLSEDETSNLIECAGGRSPLFMVTRQLVSSAKEIFGGNTTVLDRASKFVTSSLVESKTLELSEILSYFQLAQCTEYILQSGGDDRLTLDPASPEKTNKYFSSTVPRDDVIRRGSCTCTTINSSEYEFANTIRQRMLLAVLLGKNSYSNIMQDAVQSIRTQLKKIVLENAIRTPGYLVSQSVNSLELTESSTLAVNTVKEPAENAVQICGPQAQPTAQPMPMAQLMQTPVVNIGVAAVAGVVNSAYSVTSRVSTVAVDTSTRFYDISKNTLTDLTLLPVSVALDSMKAISNVDSNAIADTGLEFESILFPSGTDAEYIPLLLALNRSCNLASKQHFGRQVLASEPVIKPKVFNFVTAAGEVGSGTAPAAQGLHFSAQSPLGYSQKTSAPLFNLTSISVSSTKLSNFTTDCEVVVVTHKLRLNVNHPNLEEEEFFASIRQVFAKEPLHTVVIIHTVVCSKTGLVYPSLAQTEKLRKEFGERIIVVVDACQFRVKLSLVPAYISRNYLVLITGSKFFSGPPFSGAVLLPAQFCEELNQIKFPGVKRTASSSAHQLAEHETANVDMTLTSSLASTANVAASALTTTVSSIASLASLLTSGSDTELVADETIPVTVVSMIDVLSRSELGHYLTSFDIPVEFDGLRQFITQLPTSSPQLGGSDQGPIANVGCILRWLVGLKYLNAYSYIYRSQRSRVESFVSKWAEEVKNYIRRNCGERIELFEDPPAEEGEGSNIYPGEVCSIVSFRVLGHDQRTGAKRYLSFDEHKLLHIMLLKPYESSEPASEALEGDSSVRSSATATKVMLGQCVKLIDNDELSNNGGSVLRIALGVDSIVKSFYPEGGLWYGYSSSGRVKSEVDYEEEMNVNGDEIFDFNVALSSILAEDAIVVDKIVWLAENWTGLQSSSRGSLSPLLSADRSLATKFVELDTRLQINEEYFRRVSSEACAVKCASAADKMISALKTLQQSPSGAPPVAVLLDIDALASAFAFVKRSFDENNSSPCVHCFAIKSCPVSYVLHLAIASGLGLEAASLAEVQQALRCGCTPSKVMFDSPCKAEGDIEFALLNGVHINANSLNELQKIKNVIDRLLSRGADIRGTVGMRINPLVGCGSISELSTSTPASKFGIPLAPNSDLSMEENNALNEFDISNSRAYIIRTFVENRFLSGVMCHVGSQGMSLASMAEGAQRITQLADQIDEACRRNGEDEPRIRLIDIGGGLSVNYYGDEVTPTFLDYKRALESVSPKLFLSKHRTICTEFGKSLCAKAAGSALLVEDVIVEPGSNSHATAILHAGGDLFVRTIYGGTKFCNHRMVCLEADGNQKELENLRTTTLAGPLCFSGDNIAERVVLPTLKPQDRCLLLDAGANTISLFSRHCSRSAPAVFGFRLADDGKGHLVQCVKAQESTDKVTQFWD